ncbi:MAG TPA: hypothetical protein PKJ28_10120, partial [Bacteroidales bacterium]|nr:hypothetical protein [Bacteroidales bacterium]
METEIYPKRNKGFIRLFVFATLFFTGTFLYAQEDNFPTGNFISAIPLDAPAAANLDQARNGPYAAPLSPVHWVNGNVNQSQAHMVEGYSIPYRIVMTDMPIGQTVDLILEYDTRHSGANALDFLTGYDNLDPHNVWGHSAEIVNPVIGYPQFTLGSEAHIPIQAPTNTPTQTFFNNFMAANPGLNYLSLWGGTPTATPFQYVSEGALVGNVSSTRFVVHFVANQSTIILSWGGHIASAVDWGAGNSAGGISGSPYHTRTITWNLNNLGNQDRSMQAALVAVSLNCSFSATTPVCENSAVTGTLATFLTTDTYSWFANNQSGTTLPLTSGAISSNPFTISAGSTPGTFDLNVVASYLYEQGFYIRDTCTQSITVSAAPPCSITGDTGPVCPNTSHTYTAPAGYTYAWSISGNASITGSTTGQTVNVSAGSTCPGDFTLTLQISDTNNCTSRCALPVQILDAIPPVLIGVPDDEDLGCNPTTLPSCDPSVTASDNCGTATVVCTPGLILTQLTDNISQGCFKTQMFIYIATDQCGNTTSDTVNYSWTVDITPPVFTFCPPGSDLGCNPASFPPADTATATDNCFDPLITSVLGDPVQGQGCLWSRTRTYTATDA